MVSYVIRGDDFNTIYGKVKMNLVTKNATKLTGYLSQKDYELSKSNLLRRNTSLLVMNNSSSSLNQSLQLDNSFSSTSILNRSNSSLTQSSSKSNETTIALRENFINSSEKSARKFGSDSNLSKQPSNASSSLLKAKRQISF